MAVKLDVNQSNQTSLINHGWKKTECDQQKISTLVVEKFQQLITEYNTRKANYKNDVKVLDKGFWYQNEYLECLKEKHQNQRLEWFRNKNAFYHGFPPKGFEHICDHSTYTGKRLNGYVIKKGTPASEGLKSIKESLCFIDCQEAIEIAYYEALLEILGEEKFNQVFSADGNNPLCLDCDIGNTPLRNFLKEETNPSLSFNPGDEVGFINVPLYSNKHPNGELSGFHSLCIQSKPVAKYLAFGLSSEGATEEEIYDLFVQAFNEKPLVEIHSKDLEEKIKQDCVNRNPLYTVANTYILTKELFQEAHKQYPEKVGLLSLKRELNADKIRRILS